MVLVEQASPLGPQSYFVGNPKPLQKAKLRKHESSNSLKSINWYRYTPSIQLLDQYKFIFSRDEEGYL